MTSSGKCLETTPFSLIWTMRLRIWKGVHTFPMKAQSTCFLFLTGRMIFHTASILRKEPQGDCPIHKAWHGLFGTGIHRWLEPRLIWPAFLMPPVTVNTVSGSPRNG